MKATWKGVERRVAALMGGTRVGPTGRNTEDVEHGLFSVECKHRKKLPALLVSAYAQAKRNAPAGKVPLLVLHELGSREYIAVLPLAELMRLVGNDNLELGVDDCHE